MLKYIANRILQSKYITNQYLQSQYIAKCQNILQSNIFHRCTSDVQGWIKDSGLKDVTHDEATNICYRLLCGISMRGWNIPLPEEQGNI